MCKMYKTTVATSIALVAFAATTAVASASPVMTEFGVVVKPTAEGGGKILGTNSGNIIFTTTSGNLACTKSTLTLSLLKDTGTHVEGTIESVSLTGEGTEGRCKSTFPFNPEFRVDLENLHWCITTATVGTWSIRGGGCNEAAKNVRFTFTSSTGNCTYERSNLTGTYVAGVSPATLRLGAGQTFTRVAGSTGFCTEVLTLDGGWNLYTDNLPTETPLVIS
jgi:hypothetical protein